MLLNFLRLMQAAKLAERERVRAQLDLLTADCNEVGSLHPHAWIYAARKTACIGLPPTSLRSFRSVFIQMDNYWPNTAGHATKGDCCCMHGTPQTYLSQTASF